jgi:hypothetical protein
MGAGNSGRDAGVNKLTAPFSYGTEKPDMNRTVRAMHRGVYKRIVRVGMEMLKLSEIAVS